MRNTIALLTFPDTNVYTGGDISREGYIPNPSQYSVQESDIDLNSKRSTNGVLQRNVVRKKTYSISCSWDRLSEHQLDKLRYAWAKDKFSLKFRHNEISESAGTVTSRFVTRPAMYVDANRVFELVSTESDTEDYWSVSITFVEY